jgi:hypothetical protein
MYTPGLFNFLALEKLVQLGARCGYSLAAPIGNFGCSQAFRFAPWKKQFDRCGCYQLFTAQ